MELAYFFSISVFYVHPVFVGLIEGRARNIKFEFDSYRLEMSLLGCFIS